MDTRTRILRAVRGETVDRVPWSIYPAIIPTGEVEREMRNHGMAFNTIVTPYTRQMPDVEVIHRQAWERGQEFTYTTYRTPVGEISEKRRVEEGYGSSWIVEFLIKRPQDYRVYEYVVRHTEIVPDYDTVLEAKESVGNDGVTLAWTTRSPYQQMYIELMGIERLALDRADNVPGFLSLRGALEEQHERIYRLVAQSPADLVWCPDNLSDLVAGGKVFDSYYVPYYDRMAEILRQAGKTMVSHFDGRLGGIIEAIGRTGIPVIEAFTPPPMGNVSVPRAKAAWPEKVIWINFPGSVFLEEPAEIKRFTIELLRESMPGGRFLLGITENIPRTVYRRAMYALADGIAEFEGQGWV